MPEARCSGRGQIECTKRTDGQTSYPYANGIRSMWRRQLRKRSGDPGRIGAWCGGGTVRRSVHQFGNAHSPNNGAAGVLEERGAKPFETLSAWLLA